MGHDEKLSPTCHRCMSTTMKGFIPTRFQSTVCHGLFFQWMYSYRTSSWVGAAGSALFFGQETQFWFPEMAGLDSGTEGTVAIAGIDWFAGPNGPDNQAGSHFNRISTV